MVERLDTQLHEPTNQNSIKDWLLSQQIRKHYYKTLWTGVINNPVSPPSLVYTCSCVAGDGCVVAPHPQISCGDGGGDGGEVAGLTPCAQTLWLGHHLHHDLANKRC